MRVNTLQPQITRTTPARRAVAPAIRAAQAPAPSADRLRTRSVRPYIDVVPGKDALSLKVEKGTTLRAIAAQYAPDYDRDNTFGRPDAKDARRFYKELKKANGLWFGFWLPAGKQLTVPTHKGSGNHTLSLAIAIQKSAELRRKSGESLPALDFGRIELASGPAESFKVAVKVKGQDRFETFYVAEDLSGERPFGFQVLRPSETPFERPREPQASVVPGVTPLKVTVVFGHTLWSLAKKFAPDYNQDKTLDGAEIRRYIEQIKQANGLDSDALQEGTELVLPSSAAGLNPDMRLAMAVQQAFENRRAAGEALPYFDYSTVKLEHTRNGASVVSFQLYEDPAVMAVAVKPDTSGRHPNGYDVFLSHEAPEYFN